MIIFMYDTLMHVINTYTDAVSILNVEYAEYDIIYLNR